MCVDYFETKKYVFVHGWIPVDETHFTYDENWRYADKRAWDMARWQNPALMCQSELTVPDKTIVSGHWHCSLFQLLFNPKKYNEFGPNEKFDPFISKEVIALDRCTVHTRKVNMVVIDDVKVQKPAKINYLTQLEK